MHAVFLESEMGGKANFQGDRLALFLPSDLESLQFWRRDSLLPCPYPQRNKGSNAMGLREFAFKMMMLHVYLHAGMHACPTCVLTYSMHAVASAHGGGTDPLPLDCLL